jgi:choline-sulfatase
MDARADVLFVVLDSLRLDHVSTYGYDRETTPTLDRLSETATVYTNAYAPAPWTLPSHCSMFTGVAPAEHGVTNGFTDRDLTLPTDYSTVPQRLADSGYRTAGFSNNPWVGQLSGLDRGFDRFVEWDLEVSRGDSPKSLSDRLYDKFHGVLGRATQQPLALLKRRFFTGNLVTRACRWLETEPGSAFTFLNLMEAHSPYYPPRWAFQELGLSAPSPLSARSLNTKLLASVMGKRSLTADEQRRVHEFLDASARYQDRQLDRLLTTLRQQDRFEDALVVICADHGKTLGEFDRDGDPPHYLRSINTNVPLLVKRPGQTDARTVADPVELAGLSALLSDPDRAAPDTLTTADGYALIEDYLPHTASASQDISRWRALTDGGMTYLSGPDDEEYVLRGEASGERSIQLSEIESGTLQRFRERLRDRVSALDPDTSAPAAANGEVDGRLESQLEDLGYLS